MSRWADVYKIRKNGEREHIARVKSQCEAIKIVAEHHDDADCAIISVGSIDPEPAEAEATKRIDANERETDQSRQSPDDAL